MRHRALGGAVAAVLILGIALVATEGATWPGRDSGCVAAADCDCESLRSEGFATQPANTLSNLGFVVVGTGILATALQVPAILFGLVTIGLGVGSALFHGTATSWGGWADLAALYAFLSLVIAVTVGELLGWGARRTVGAFASASLALWVLQVPLDQGAGKYVVGVLVAMAVVTELAMWDRPRDRRWLLAAAAVLGASLVVWTLSRTAWCDPESAVQGHAVWHIGAAIAVALLYRYLRPALVNR